jgi:hypothetical protein
MAVDRGHNGGFVASRYLSFFVPIPDSVRPFGIMPASLSFLNPRLISHGALFPSWLRPSHRLALSPLKGSSIFKPAANAVDKITKPITGFSSPVTKLGKMGKFTADSNAHVTYGPAELTKPFFIAKQVVCFR